MVQIASDDTAYTVGTLVAATATYRLYLATDLLSREWRLLQIAAAPEHNGGLDRAAFLLERFARSGAQLDAEYARSHERKHLHYERLHPTLVKSFLSPEQGNRRVNILALADVADLRSIVPLSNLLKKDRRRVDPETSAWIMGRLLKLLSFVHAEGVANRAMMANNVLLDPDQHFAITLDWSVARVFPSTVPAEHAATDIKMAATAVFSALGGSVANNSWPYEGHEPYIALLRQLMLTGAPDADKALDAFYATVRAEYGQSFHPFTTLSLT